MGFELYPFQQEDVAKLAEFGSGLIGSEMGVGKTHQAIALDDLWFPESKNRPTLVVAPLNTFSSWQEKYGMQAPQNDVVLLDRKNREAFLEAIRRKRGDVFVMHWDALRLMKGLYSLEFGTVIGDEVHRIANRKAQVTLAAKKLQALHKLAMSGTATGDRPENLWSVLNWLYPRDRRFTSYWRFRKQYCATEEQEVYRKNDMGETVKASYTKVVGVKNQHELMENINPFYVRHLKREQCCEHHPKGVMSYLPEKTYDRIWVDLTPGQRRVYNQMRDEMVAWVGEHEDSPLVAGVVVAQMTRLSQIALATPEIYTKMVRRRLREEEEGYPGLTEPFPVEAVRLIEPSTKLDALQEFLLDHDNKQFVIATSSKQISYLAQEKFERKGISSFVLSGDTPDSQRHDMVHRFANGDTQLFIGVIEAMAEGIDGLQHATDTMIFLDRSWRTVKNKQCEDRLHRDGQKNTVQIIDMMAKDTLDMGRAQRLELKWSWIKEILGDYARVQDLARSNIVDLSKLA